MRRVDFSKFSSIKIGPVCDVVLIKSIQSLPKGHYLIGGCNNILLSPNSTKLAMLGKEFDFIRIENDILKVGAAYKSGRLLSFAKKHNLANFEFLHHLPGTIGGLLKMNAGLQNHAISDHLLRIKTQNGWINRENLNFSYRNLDLDEVIFEAEFKIGFGFFHDKMDSFFKARLNQPKDPSCGSCFKNPPNNFAGRLIEAVGLKGEFKNGVGFSQKHANFLVNLHKGRFEDAIFMIELAKKRVFEEFGLILENEIKIV